MAVPIRLDSAGGTVDVGTPVSLFAPNLPMAPAVPHARHYMVTRDGKRLLVQTLKQVTMPIAVLLNWRPK